MSDPLLLFSLRPERKRCTNSGCSAMRRHRTYSCRPGPCDITTSPSSFANRPSSGFRRMTSTASDGRRRRGVSPGANRHLLDLDGHGCPGAFWGAAAREAAHECPGADRVQEGRVRSRKRQRAPRLARAWAFVRALAADPRRSRPRRRDHLRDRRQRVVRAGCVEVE